MNNAMNIGYLISHNNKLIINLIIQQ